MKTKSLFFLIILSLLFSASVCLAQQAQPFIGVLLDEEPISDLLAKHLKLSPGQGIRISNIVLGSTADTLGLDRDDIIIRFQDYNVTDMQRFIDAVSKAGVGAKVNLEVIHLGEVKKYEFTLTAKPAGQLENKYPNEAGTAEIWTPGRLYRLNPDQDSWIQIPFDNMPDVQSDIQTFFNEKYVFTYSRPDGLYTVTIKGDPNDKDTRIIVRKGNTEYNITIADLDQLTKEYRDVADQALSEIKNRRIINIPQVGPFSNNLPDWINQFFNRDFNAMRDDIFRRAQPFNDMDLNTYRDSILERMEQQFEKLHERMGQLEGNYKDMKDRLDDMLHDNDANSRKEVQEKDTI